MEDEKARPSRAKEVVGRSIQLADEAYLGGNMEGSQGYLRLAIDLLQDAFRRVADRPPRHSDRSKPP